MSPLWASSSSNGFVKDGDGTLFAEESPVCLWIFCNLGPTGGFVHVDLVSFALSNALILMSRPQMQS